MDRLDLKRKLARLGVLMGGWSGEREVSLASGRNVCEALLARGYRAEPLDVRRAEDLLPSLEGVEVAFNCLHGGIGEDGTLQALLEVLEVPYTGSGVLASALALDKLKAKKIFRQEGLPTPDHMEPGDVDKDVDVTADADAGAGALSAWCREALERLGAPLVVKPVRQGSSLGVRIVRGPEEGELEAACRATQAEYGAFFVERYIPGLEVTAGVLRVDGEDRALPLIELRPKRPFYDYRAKYTPGLTEFVIPARLSEEATRRVQALALKAHQVLGCFGYSRVDLRVSGDRPYVLEVNTAPGMTATSDLPQAAAAAGIGFEDLVEHMLRTAVEKAASGNLLNYSRTINLPTAGQP